MPTINKEYQALVYEAKETLKDIENSKMHIADLAIKACTIKLGGHLTGFYSITNFADDIGVNRKTLSCWIHNRKIQKELEKKKIVVKDETELNRIRIALREDSQGQQGNINKYSNNTFVLQAYEQNKKISIEDQHVRNMINSLGTIKFRLGSYILSKLDQENLKSVHTLIQEIDEKLKKHFNKTILRKARSRVKTLH